MALTRWNPYREMVSLRDAMNRLFDDSWLAPQSSTESSGDRMGVFVPLDMTENDEEVTISAPLPGLKPEDVDISVTGNTLTIKGEFRHEQEEEHENVHYRERHYGTFRRTINLPANLEADKAEATVEDGVLKLTLPKIEEARPKQIEVKAQSERSEK